MQRKKLACGAPEFGNADTNYNQKWEYVWYTNYHQQTKEITETIAKKRYFFALINRVSAVNSY